MKGAPVYQRREMKPIVWFLHLAPHAKRGSVALRCDQLSKIGSLFLGERFEFRTLAIPTPSTGGQTEAIDPVRGGVVILSKSTIGHLEPEAFLWLKRHAIAVLADYIDRSLRSPFQDEIDLHIAASRAFEAIVKRKMPGGRVRYLPHHADLRLHGVQIRSSDRLKCVYVGHPRNNAVDKDLRSRLTVLAARNSGSFGQLAGRLREFNLHLNVRTPSKTRITSRKPPTKIVTAATLGANVLLQDNVDDALDLLGSEYPFLLPESDAPTVRTALDRAEALYGGPEWQRGLEIMAEVAWLHSPAKVAAELDAILTEILGGP
ncbi:MAG: hypothetical protein AAFY03_02315 [Pseudomonadota bacterium]